MTQPLPLRQEVLSIDRVRVNLERFPGGHVDPVVDELGYLPRVVREEPDSREAKVAQYLRRDAVMA